jgi:hypothetical protein
MAPLLRNWMMFALTLVFVALYGVALMGWAPSWADEQTVTRLEPIIFVIIGYYFGRLPSQQNESALKEEISRQAQKAEAAQHAKEQAQQNSEMLAEKMKNVRTFLASAALGTSARNAAGRLDGVGEHNGDQALRHSVAAALNILNS